MSDQSEALSSDRELDVLRDLSRPKKRRRLEDKSSSQQLVESDETDSDDYDLPANGKVHSDYDHDDIGSPQLAPAKSKYLMHVPQYDEPQEKMFVSQLTQHHSSPERIRGARWRKKPPAAPTPVPAPLFGATATHPVRPLTRDVPQPPISPQEVENPDNFEEDDPAVIEAMFSSLEHDRPSNNDILVLSSQNERFGPSPSRKASTSFRQTTLFGNDTTAKAIPASQSRRHNWPLSNKIEPPSHHKLNSEAMKTWVYPTNLGEIRDYQFNITQRGLFHNLLVALPTGLGKTFIAATIMLNWFRWTVDAQIVFVAPTKPLVAQQIEACFGIAGIPRSTTSMLTGVVQPAVRAEEWQEKRVFFMTPQTLVHDLKSGICDPKKIVLLVVDEAHRATGNYAYVEVVRFLKRFTSSFRVLALTATPGSSVEAVQSVIDGLDIARTEIRTEESLDIRQYVYTRSVELQVFDNTEELTMAMELFGTAIRPVLNKLTSQNAFWSKDPMKITAFGLMQARKQWMGSDAGRKANFGTKGMINSIVNVLASLAHALDLLKYHGIGPFYAKLRAFESETLDGSNNSKYAKEIAMNEHFKKLMNRLKGWINNPDFVGHPKSSYLQQVVLEHFMDAGKGRGAAGGRPPSDTRIMVFVNFRDSAEEIARILKRHYPMIRPHVFVGQSTTKESQGMDQKTQLDIIEKFQKGTYNTIVATSIGEEGLDIGEVDLIVCYDSHASPIRMLQRMGRTGRKRAGKIVLLLMRGKEEESYTKAKDNYEVMQKKIANGSDFNYHDDRSQRIMPKEIVPVVDKRQVEIPLENTQADLPEPKRRTRKQPKKPAKKFHMPDGVETGFTFLGEGGKSTRKTSVEYNSTPLGSFVDQQVAPLPLLEKILLSKEEEELLDRYRSIGGDTEQYVQPPRLDRFPSFQGTPRKTSQVAHSTVTRRLVRTLERMKDRSFYLTMPRDSQARFEHAGTEIEELQHENDVHLIPDGDSDPESDISLNSLTKDKTPMRQEAEIKTGVSVADDNSSDLEEVGSLDIASPFPCGADNAFYVSQQSAMEEDDLEDELPDFGKMVSAKAPRDNEMRGKGPRRLVRRKRVISDDSDN